MCVGGDGGGKQAEELGREETGEACSVVANMAGSNLLSADDEKKCASSSLYPRHDTSVFCFRCFLVLYADISVCICCCGCARMFVAACVVSVSRPDPLSSSRFFPSSPFPHPILPPNPFIPASISLPRRVYDLIAVSHRGVVKAYRQYQQSKDMDQLATALKRCL